MNIDLSERNMPSRRQYLLLSGTSLTSALSGCMSAGNLVGGDSSEDESSGEQNSTANESTTNETKEDPEDSEEDVEEESKSEEPRLGSKTEKIFQELRWFETEYESIFDEYRSQLHRASESLKGLLESLDAEGEITMEEFESTSSLLDEVAESVSGMFKPHFTDEYNFAALNYNYVPEIRRYVEFNDWSPAREQIEELRNAYRATSASSHVLERYPRRPIDNRLHSWFGGGNKMYEVRYVGDDSSHRHSDSEYPGFGRYVVNNANREVSYEPIGGAPRRVYSTIQSEYSSFFAEKDRTFTIYLNVHNVGSDGNIDPSTTNSDSVLIQRYTDTEAAEYAFEYITDKNRVDGEEEIGKEVWTRIAYMDDEDKRMYAFAIQSGKYIFAIGPSSDIWEKRSGNWNNLLNGTFILSSTSNDSNSGSSGGSNNDDDDDDDNDGDVEDWAL